MLELLAPFLVGLTGSLHCLGMCGPLVIAWSLRYRTALQAGSAMGKGGLDSAPLAASISPSSASGAATGLFSGAFFHHIAFHFGRVFTYGILGALVAGFFRSLEVQRFAMQYRAGFAVGSGIILILLGAILFGVLPLPHFVTRLFSPQAAAFGKIFAKLAGSIHPFSKAGLGFVSGFLPCGLTWAMLVAAAITLNPVNGFAVMVSFGLGTIPVLLAAGMSASLLSARTRLLGERTAAIFIVIMGASVMVRGLWTLLGGGGCCMHF